jgi:hypothetical protein
MPLTVEELKQCHWGHALCLDGAKGMFAQTRTCKEHPRLAKYVGRESSKHPVVLRLTVDGLRVANLAEAAAALNRTEEENATMAEQQASMPLAGGAGEKKWTLKEGIAEIKREQFHRGRVYPRLVASGQLDQADANKQDWALQGTLTFLEFCLKNEAKLRQVMTEG